MVHSGITPLHRLALWGVPSCIAGSQESGTLEPGWRTSPGDPPSIDSPNVFPMFSQCFPNVFPMISNFWACFLGGYMLITRGDASFWAILMREDDTPQFWSFGVQV